jgi:hypothetical protein
MNIFFTCGTGRSGTTITKKIFSQHTKVFTFPFEARFLSDPDGLVDLYVSLQQLWSPFLIDTKIKRLQRLVKRISKTSFFDLIFFNVTRVLNRKRVLIESPSYAKMNFSKFNPEIDISVNKFLSSLQIDSYCGSWDGNVQLQPFPKMYFGPSLKNSDLSSIFRELISDIINPILDKNSCSHWCEDSPYSILYANHLHDILPTAKFLHLYRDPRDVVSSYKNQKWAPTDTVQSTKLYKSNMERIIQISKQLPADVIKNISLEQLVQSPQKEIEKISDFVGLDVQDEMLNVALNRSNSGRWKKELSLDEQKYVSRELDEIIHYFGYNNC